jgi:hypothetical protein
MSVRAIRPVHASDARWLYLRFDDEFVDVLSQARRLRVADGGRPVERGDGAWHVLKLPCASLTDAAARCISPL